MDKTLGATAAQVDTNTELGGPLPTTFAHLMLVVNGRIDSGVVGGLAASVFLRFNNDSANNYASGRVENSGVAAATASEINSSNLGADVGDVAGPVSTNPATGVLHAWIGDYNGTTFHKTVVADSFSRSGLTTGTWKRVAAGGKWNSTAAITRIQIRVQDTTNMVFAVGSRFTLYGLG